MPPFAVGGTLYYDWDLRAQRIEHGAGAFECVNFYGTDAPCTLIVTEQGLHRQLEGPLPAGQPRCCLDMPTLGPLPPDWASAANATYLGVLPVPGGGVASRAWSFELNSSGVESTGPRNGPC